MQAKRSREKLPAGVNERLETLGDFARKRELRRWLLRLFQEFTPVLVAVFGSVPRGEATPESDVDVLVVADDFPLNPLERHDALNLYAIPGIDARPYQVKEYLEMVREWDLTVLEAFHDHWFVHDPEGIGARDHETFTALRQASKLVRHDHAWSINA